MTKRLTKSSALRSPAVRPSDGRGVDSDEDLVVLGHRPLDLLEPQDLGRPVPVVDDRSHALTSQVRGKRWIGLPWFQASPRGRAQPVCLR